MSYDTSGPVKVNEVKSLALLVILVVLVAGGIWIALAVNKPRRAPVTVAALKSQAAEAPVVSQANRAARPAEGQRRRPRFRPDPSPDGVSSRPAEGITLVKAGGVYVTIAVSDVGGKTKVRAFRSRPRDEKAELWALAAEFQRIASQPATAERYGIVPDQVAAIEALKIRTPQLTGEQERSVIDLYNAIAAAKPEDKTKAENALTQGVRDMTTPDRAEKAFESQLDKARSILHPDQMQRVENSF